MVYNMSRQPPSLDRWLALPLSSVGRLVMCTTVVSGSQKAGLLRRRT